jgi:hypothetical protein
MEERLFTLEEASRLLPRIRTILEEVTGEWRRVRELNPEIQKVRDKAPMDAFTPYGVQYVEAVSHLMFLLHQIKEMGVHLKDADKGLCDFPYMRRGHRLSRWHLVKSRSVTGTTSKAASRTRTAGRHRQVGGK